MQDISGQPLAIIETHTIPAHLDEHIEAGHTHKDDDRMKHRGTKKLSPSKHDKFFSAKGYGVASKDSWSGGKLVQMAAHFAFGPHDPHDL